MDKAWNDLTRYAEVGKKIEELERICREKGLLAELSMLFNSWEISIRKGARNLHFNSNLPVIYTKEKTLDQALTKAIDELKKNDRLYIL